LTRKKWLYPSLIIFFVMLFFFQIILGTAFFGWDILDYHYPYLYQTINAYRSFDYLWSPFVLSGYPVFADPQAAISYPFNILLSLLKVNPGYIIIELQLIFHFMLAGIFSYYYFVKIGFKNNLSFFGSLIFIFGGFMATHTEHYGTIDAIAWMPLILILLENYFENKKNLFYILLAGLVFGVSILAGHVQTSLNIAYLIILYIAWKTIFIKVKNVQKLWIFIKCNSVLFTISALIALVQILPTLQLMTNSPRAEMTLDGSMAANLVPIHLISLFIPYFFGKFGFSPSWFPREIVESHLYMGLIPAVLLICGFIIFSSKVNETKDSIMNFWFIVTPIYLLMSFGGETILHYINYYFVPGYGKLRRSYNFYSIVSFGFALISIYSLSYLKKEFSSLSAIINKIVTVILIAFGVLLSLFYITIVINKDYIDILKPIMNNLVIGILILVLFWLILNLYKYNKINYNSFSILLFVLFVIDVYSFNANQTFNAQKLNVKTVVTQSALYGEHLEFVPAIKERNDIDQNNYNAKKIIYLGFPATIQNQSILFGFENVYSYNPMRVNSYDEFLRLVFPAKDESSLGNDIRFESSMFNMLGVRYIVMTKEYMDLNNVNLAEPHFTSLGAYNGGKYYLFVNNNVYPESYISYNVTSMPEDAILKYISNENEIKEIVFSDHNYKIKSNIANEEVILNKVNNEKFSMDVNMKADGAILLNKPFYKGWVAYIDGEKEEVSKVNGAFIGLHLSKGIHQIDFSFEPKIYYLSALISLLTLLSVTIYVIICFLRKRKRNTNEASDSD
jgi:hypothetical protein